MVEKRTLSGIKLTGATEALPCFNKVTLSTILGREGESLNYWVKRLIRTGEIVPLKRGLFVGYPFLLKIKGQSTLVDTYREFAASLLRQPSYISLEYALAKYGILTEAPFAVTSTTVKSTRTFANKLGTFIFRNIKRPLFTGYVEASFLEKRYPIATRAKALFDWIYLRTFEPATFEMEIMEGLRINWDALKKTDRTEMERYVDLSGQKKMGRFLDTIVRRRLL